MTLILDTDVLIELYKGNKNIITDITDLMQRHPDNPFITFANFSEFYIGFLKKNREKREHALQFLGMFSILHTTRGSAQLFAEIQHMLEKRGEAIPVLDSLIAAIAMEKNMTLVTRDNHFKKIEHLNVISL